MDLSSCNYFNRTVVKGNKEFKPFCRDALEKYKYKKDLIKVFMLRYYTIKS